ncbi:hypothetical protein [Streptomyces sp. NPDC059788]|uniref:hypothetical protein n=1 Tax=Streptomyces sp. NPDC059788 TaxID=3346948 RepID=UPI003650E1A2
MTDSAGRVPARASYSTAIEVVETDEPTADAESVVIDVHVAGVTYPEVAPAPTRSSWQTPSRTRCGS